MAEGCLPYTAASLSLLVQGQNRKNLRALALNSVFICNTRLSDDRLPGRDITTLHNDRSTCKKPRYSEIPQCRCIIAGCVPGWQRTCKQTLLTAQGMIVHCMYFGGSLGILNGRRAQTRIDGQISRGKAPSDCREQLRS